MAKIVFYGGVNEIGGNKVLVEDRTSRVFLDFGMSFKKRNDYFDEFLKPRSNSPLRDLITLGHLPPVDGIYRQDFLELDGVEDLPIYDQAQEYVSSDVKSYDEYMSEHDNVPFLDAVLLSHAHADHFQFIPYLDHKIPIYCSKETMVMLEAICDVSRSLTENEIWEYKPRSLGAHGNSSTFPEQPKIVSGGRVARDIRAMDGGVETNIGNLKVEAIPVDHSVPGALSFLITTSDGKSIVYTGDLRFHGSLDDRTKTFRQKTGNLRPDVLITEGTNMKEDEKESEKEVHKKVKKAIEDTQGLSLVHFGWKDTTRFETVQQAADECGRTFLINAKTAYLLKALADNLGQPHKSPFDYPNVKVYLKRRSSQLYSLGDYTGTKYDAGYFADWGSGPTGMKAAYAARDAGTHDTYLDVGLSHIRNGVKAFDVKASPSTYALMFSYYDVNELFDLAPFEGCSYIHAATSPFNDEMGLDEEKLVRWLEYFGIKSKDSPLMRAHCSGHASGPDIKDMIRKIKPKTIYPIHAEKESVDIFKAEFDNVTVPELSPPLKEYQI